MKKERIGLGEDFLKAQEPYNTKFKKKIMHPTYSVKKTSVTIMNVGCR